MRELKKPLRFYRFDMIDVITSMLDDGKSVEANLRGTSMEPTIHDGERIIIEPVNGIDLLKIGQIVAIESENHRHFVVHRIKSINKESGLIYEQGDNRDFGSYVDWCRVKGIVNKV